MILEKRSKFIKALALYGILYSFAIYVLFYLMFMSSYFTEDFHFTAYTNKFGEFYPEVGLFTFSLICGLLGVIKFIRYVVRAKDR